MVVTSTIIRGFCILASTSQEAIIVKAILSATTLLMLSGAALANHECRVEMFETTSGRMFRLVPSRPIAHCGARGRVAATEREARLKAYYDRGSGRASPRR